MIGKLKFYDEKKKFGFIRMDVFFRGEDIDASIKTDYGVPVTFEVRANSHGELRAFNIQGKGYVPIEKKKTLLEKIIQSIKPKKGGV